VEKIAASLAVGTSNGMQIPFDVMLEAIAMAFNIEPAEFTDFGSGDPVNVTNATNETSRRIRRRLTATCDKHEAVEYSIVIPPGTSDEALQNAMDLLQNGPAFERMLESLKNAMGDDFSLCIVSLVDPVVYTDQVARSYNGTIVCGSGPVSECPMPIPTPPPTLQVYDWTWYIWTGCIFMVVVFAIYAAIMIGFKLTMPAPPVGALIAEEAPVELVLEEPCEIEVEEPPKEVDPFGFDLLDEDLGEGLIPLPDDGMNGFDSLSDDGMNGLVPLPDYGMTGLVPLPDEPPFFKEFVNEKGSKAVML
jgi:hypothetical protein